MKYINNKPYILLREGFAQRVALILGEKCNNDFLHRLYRCVNEIIRIGYTPSEIGSFRKGEYYKKSILDYMLTHQMAIIKEKMSPLSESKENESHKRIFITEEQANVILNKKDKEHIYHVDADKVLLVKRYLDAGFKRANLNTVGSDGYPTSIKIVGMIGCDGSILKNMTSSQLFYLLQDRFSKIYKDKNKRDTFLKKVMSDWYERKISNQGLLSVNNF